MRQPHQRKQHNGSSVRGRNVSTILTLAFAVVLAIISVLFSDTALLTLPDQADIKRDLVVKKYEPTNTSCFAPHAYFRPSPTSARTLALPIINLGFPKAGTTSLEAFFKCGGLDVSHQYCWDYHLQKVTNNTQRGDYCGRCIRDGIARGDENPLANCGGFDAYLQLDASFPPKLCFWPQVQALEEIHKEHPNATFILNFRSSFAQWYDSVSHWYGMSYRIGTCIDELNLTDYGAETTPLYEKLESFFCHHVETVRNFVLQHPSHTLVEVEVEANNTGSFLSDVFGINKTCWGHENANPRNQTKATSK